MYVQLTVAKKLSTIVKNSVLDRNDTASFQLTRSAHQHSQPGAVHACGPEMSPMRTPLPSMTSSSSGGALDTTYLAASGGKCGAVRGPDDEDPDRDAKLGVKTDELQQQVRRNCDNEWGTARADTCFG